MRTNPTNACGKNEPRRHLRRYLVNPVLPWKYTVAVMLGVFVVTSVMSSLLFNVLQEQARASALHQINMGTTTTTWENVLVVFVAGLSFACLMSMAFGLWALIATHRIYGPIFVMERLLNKLADGKIPEYRSLRTKDEFKGVHGALCRAIDTLKANKQFELDKLNEAIKIARGDAEGDAKSHRVALASIATYLETLRDQAVRRLGEEPATEFENLPAQTEGSSNKKNELQDVHS